VINHALFITPDTHAHARVLFVPEAVVVAWTKRESYITQIWLQFFFFHSHVHVHSCLNLQPLRRESSLWQEAAWWGRATMFTHYLEFQKFTILYGSHMVYIKINQRIKKGAMPLRSFNSSKKPSTISL
jgi:hypothetical protein